MSEKPVVAITMGDPAGCGPEVTVKALRDGSLYDACRPLVIGDAAIIRKARDLLGAEEISVRPVRSVADAGFCKNTIDVYDLGVVDMASFVPCQVSAMCGDAAFRSVKKAIGLALDGAVDATVTNALNKEALNAAGHHYSGHTEIYAQMTGTTKYTMMLAHGDLRVVHVSTHVSLREACDRVRRERVLDVIRIASDACRSLGIENPKVGVAGLNPHSGENGLFGREELEEIIPAIGEARSEGIDVQGPVPADTVFCKARGGWYDIVVAMYHDQGHIPLKLLGFVYDRQTGRWSSVSGVNITLGLPIIRTSVDHGTAFDCAWQGVANESSLVNAINYAIDLANSKGKGEVDG